MLQYIVPQMALADLPSMCRVALIGAMIAGVYGVLHYQITYSISPEYFTNLKFEQFHWADVGLGDRVFASTIGFLATSCVGLISAWFLARRFIPRQPRSHAYRQICMGFACVLACGMSFGLLGFAYGLWRGPVADYSSWAWAFQKFHITETWSFVRVVYIHNAGYLGGAIGLIVALTTIRPRRKRLADADGT
jgi:hypothetical protein